MNNKTEKAPSLFEELSLSLGHSLNIMDNCDKFFSILFTIKDLLSSSVWMIEKHVINNEENEYLTPIYTIPELDIEKPKLDIDHGLVKKIKSNGHLILSSSDNLFKNIFISANGSFISLNKDLKKLSSVQLNHIGAALKMLTIY